MRDFARVEWIVVERGACPRSQGIASVDQSSATRARPVCPLPQGTAGRSKVFSHFYRGNGTLRDLEFLTSESGRRLAGPGRRRCLWHIGLVVAKEGEEARCIDAVLERGQNGRGRQGSCGGRYQDSDGDRNGFAGRCGTGAMDLFRKVELPESVSFVHCHASEANATNQRFNGENGMRWDQAETVKDRPVPGNRRT